MKTLQVFHSVDGELSEILDTPTYAAHRIPYKGFSRGLGEFMEKCAPMADLSIPWIMFQCDDEEIDYNKAVEACLESPYHYWGFGLSDDSYADHPCTRRGSQRTGWRTIKYYDHGMFYSSDFFPVISPFFKESKSFWGLELLSAKLHKARYGTTCGLYCGAEMRHTRPVRSRDMMIDGKSPMQELQEICAKYHVHQ